MPDSIRIPCGCSFSPRAQIVMVCDDHSDLMADHLKQGHTLADALELLAQAVDEVPATTSPRP
jgi:hypothetical protein